LKVLFVCSRNRLRSLTAESIFNGRNDHEVRSVGTEEGARIRITPGHIGWADLIFVMEKAHRNKLNRKFRAHLKGKRVICLDIPDQYDFMDPALVTLLNMKVPRHLPRP